MLQLLQNKVAIVTGGAQGIGQAIAETLAEHGAAVVVADIQGEQAKGIAAGIVAIGDGRRALGVQLDVTNKASVTAMVQDAIAAFGVVDILVNNAGILRPNFIVDIPEADWDMVFAVNMKGTFLCSQAVAKVMIPNKQGSIINIASASAKKPDPKGAAYNSSKSAIIGFTRVLALELGQYNIRANAICPGATDTVMLRNLCSEMPGFFETLCERTVLGRIATPRDQANVVVFLASELASHVTGEAIIVAGGELMGQ